MLDDPVSTESELEHSVFDAVQVKNADALEALLADQFILLRTTGETIDKATCIGNRRM